MYQEISQVKAYFKRPLSTWIPSAQSLPSQSSVDSSRDDVRQGRKKWLADIPEFANWRNAALDCVDALHLEANGTIAALSGTEHPMVLHLHLARLVLLVPHQEILKLVLAVASCSSKCSGLQGPSSEEAVQAEWAVVQWAQRDEVSHLTARTVFGWLTEWLFA